MILIKKVFNAIVLETFPKSIAFAYIFIFVNRFFYSDLNLYTISIVLFSRFQI